MLLFTLPFLITSSAKPTPAVATSIAPHTPRRLRPAVAPDTTSPTRTLRVGGLDHYIDSRLAGERFRIH